MDVIFDIDGTLANAEHRLHHIVPDPNRLYEEPFKKDWDAFLSDEAVAKDAPIPQTWRILSALLFDAHATILFITGRPESQRQVTHDWLYREDCEHRCLPRDYWRRCPASRRPVLYMRKYGDRRPSHIVKEELLHRAIADGFKPQMVFEDRKDDTAMWRRNGLLCLQVADGDY